jgi:hypothetical protein
MKKALMLLPVLFVLLLPAVTQAGLVPCTGVDVAGGMTIPTCQACDLVTLINNVVTWLVGVLSIIFAIIFVVAGYRMVASGGNVSEKQAAQKMITNAFIGFVLVLAGWLLTDLVMKMLLGGSDIGTFGPWQTIECVGQPGSMFMGESRGLVSGAGAIVGGTLDTSYTGSCDPITDPSNPCHPDQPEMIAAFGSRVQQAAVICNKESGGAPVKSGSDLCCGPSGNCAGAPSFSGGYFQINVLVHNDMISGTIPGCSGNFFQKNGNNTAQGNCVRRNSGGVCTGWSCTITNPAVYNECMKVTQDSALNFAIAKQLFDARGFQPWSWSAKKCSVPF